jgi:PD-(D/E)XK endonuclease
MERLGKTRRSGSTNVQQRVECLALDTSHFVFKASQAPLVAPAHPFTNPAAAGAHAGLGVAVRWFLERNYVVSIPLEPIAYDLIADSGSGLKRVQVKTSSRRDRSGRYEARLTRTVYDSTVEPNARGNYREAPYPADALDYFFILTSDFVKYLIPLDVVAGMQHVVLDVKYAAFAIELAHARIWCSGNASACHAEDPGSVPGIHSGERSRVRIPPRGT